MTSSERQELEALRLEVADLRDRLRAYEGLEHDEAAAAEWAARVDWWAGRFRAVTPQAQHQRTAARALLVFLARPGRRISRAAFTEALRSEAETDSIASVVVCGLRKALTALGIEGAIETLWGFGYCMPAPVAERLEALERQWRSA